MVTKAIPRVHSVVINVIDFEGEKRFWSELLGVGISREFPGYFCWLEPQHEGAISVALQHVDDPTAGRNRVHLDTIVKDVDEVEARVIELGGSHLEDHEIGGFTWKVMADPEGNEFCIVPG